MLMMTSVILNLTWTVPLIIGLCTLMAVLVAFLLFILFVWNEHRKYRHIPGPKRKSFFYGNISELKDKEKLLCEIFLDHALVYGPVFVWWYLCTPIVVISSPELIKYGLITLNLPKAPSSYNKVAYLFGRHRFLGTGLFTQLNHDIWKQKRRLINPAFHRGYLKELIPQFNTVADSLIAKLLKVADGKTVIDMADEFQKATLDVIGKVAFSMDLRCIDDQDSEISSRLFKCLEGYQESYKQPFLCLPFYKRSYQKSVSRSLLFLRTLAKECIQKRQQAMRNGQPLPNDILGMILETDVQSEESVNIEEMVDEFLTFFVGGQDTTANQLSFALLETLINENIENRIFHEVDNLVGTKETIEYDDTTKLEYLGQTLKESLRKHPPATGTVRVTTKPEKFGQFQIPKGTKLIFSIFVSHHLPEHWRDPEQFIPERFSVCDKNRISNFVYFPFSCGARICIGKVFSAINATVLMARLFQKFKFQLVSRQAVQRDETLTIHPKGGVCCTIKERSCVHALN